VRGDGRTAVVKIFHAHLTSDPTFAARFRKDVAAAAGLHHPHIVRIEDFGEQGGQFYIIMELLADGSMRTLLQRRESMLPLRRGVDLVRQTADALAYAHAQHVVHRDVKPENLLVRLSDTDRDIVKLADVGLTTLTESGVTVGGNVALGSFAYMSPEQCRGITPDARSDIYSLGVVLYEAVTGYPPFQVKTLADALTKHTSAPPPSPRSLVRDLPEELERIILRCLAKNPVERWGGASELMRALDPVLAALPAAPVVKLAEPAPAPAAGAPQGPMVELREGKLPPPQPVSPPKSRYRVDLEPASPGGASPGGVSKPASPPEGGRIKVSMDAERRMRPTIPTDMKPDSVRPLAGGESKRIRVALDRTAISLTPGQPTVFNVTLNNGGRTVDHLSLAVEGVPDGWVKGPPQAPQLNPGQRATVPLTVTVPRTPESLAGEYPVTIRARSRENAGESGTALASWTVLPFAQSQLSLSPSRVRGWRRVALRASLRNQGNTPAQYTLTGGDEEQVLRWDIPESQVPLEAGQTTTVKLRSTAPIRWLGSPEHRPFIVKAEATRPTAPSGAAEPPLAAQGQFIHRAIIPTWLPPLLLLAAAGAYFLLRDRGQVNIALQPPAAQVVVGGKAQLTASVTDRRNETLPGLPIAWESRDTTVAVVSDSGVVTGRREGATLIAARTGKRVATAQVSVVPPRVEGVIVAPKTLALKIGSSAVLRAQARDAGGGQLRRDFTWQSSDPTVVTVGGNGRVTAKGPGSATITVQTEGKTATADVTVAELPPGETATGTEDCVNYDPAPLKIVSDRSAGWVLTDGSNNLLTLDNESDAQRALALARRFKSHCFLGRGNTRPNRSDYIIEYWEAPTRAPTVIDAEDCVRYDPASLRIVESGAQGFVLTDGRSRLLAADTQKDAQKAWDIAQKHASLCFIGRGNRRLNQRDYIVQYWK
jgi:serine/threonine protein kinase